MTDTTPGAVPFPQLASARELTAVPRARVFAANVTGALAVFLYLALISPPATSSEESYALEVVAVSAYIILAGGLGYRLADRILEPVLRWVDAQRPPTEDELRKTLEQPFRQARLVFGFWVGGAVLFTAIHVTPSNPIHYDPEYGLLIGEVILLGGLASAMLSYLLVEQGLRPVLAAALSYRLPSRPQTLGVAQRIMASWALGSGVILIAIGLAPTGTPRVAWAIWFLVPVGLVAGGIIIMAAARSVAQPIGAMRHALERIQQGDYEARVPVDDGSEVGLLQAGFNRMAAGLSERERLRQIFGTYVDPDVAQHILREGTSLAGEEVEVTVMFIDVRDFTGFAERSSPQQVVTSINTLFERVVPIIRDHGGHIDKFVGDGLLAVFGAPRRYDDHADRGLRAGLNIAAAIRSDSAAGLEIGIGLNSGRVIAGNVGGAGRFEFSVIGDAVNVAARIEAATRSTGDEILVSERTKELLQSRAFLLEPRREIHLKGKKEPVCLYAAAPANADSD